MIKDWEYRALELRAQGLLYKQIAYILNEEGFRTSHNKLFNEHRIIKRICYHKLGPKYKRSVVVA